MGEQGCAIGWRCWVGQGINKKMSTMQETAFLGCPLTVGWVRGQLGQGENTFG